VGPALLPDEAETADRKMKREEIDAMQEHPGQSYLEANVRPQEMSSVNWSAAPLPFKLYRNANQIKCTYERKGPDGPLAEQHAERAQIGQILLEVYGLTRQDHTLKEEGPIYPFPLQLPPDPGFHTSLLRPVPSGGALFPCELYLLVAPGKSFPAGIYHYDAAHHALDIIRQGDYSHLLQTSLAHPSDIPPAYAFLLSCFFWKDGFKYGAFSYRLQGLDIGTVIAQSEVVTGHYDLEATIHYQFLDTAINDLLGLDPLHESIYAVIALSPAYQGTLDNAETHAADAPQEPIQFQAVPMAEPLESIASWPLPEAVHRASYIETRAAFCALRSLPPIEQPETIASQSLSPSDEALDLWKARYQRHSASGFLPGTLTEQQFAQLLFVSTRGCTTDLDERSDLLLHTLLYCVVNRVENIPPGIYCYHPEKHILGLVSAGEVQSAFQALLGWANLNLFQMSICLVPVANYKSGFQVYGDRWYRMQNMEAGIIAQRLYLAAAALNLGCRANLGYDVPNMNTFLCLPDEYTSLLQILIAPEQHKCGRYAQSLLL
jgi:SagB-type dehydrogenase family enzyme